MMVVSGDLSWVYLEREGVMEGKVERKCYRCG